MNFIYNAPVERGAPGTLMPSANRPMLSLPQHIKTLLLGVKLAALLILTTCLQVSAKITTAQKLSISFHNGSLDKLFTEIERKTSYVFFYDATILKGTKPVSVEMKEASIEEILQASLKGQALEYEIRDRTIFVKKNSLKNAINDGPGGGANGPKEVRGTIMADDGSPLAGATIKLKTGKIVGITDERGQFRLKEVSVGATIEVSYTGYAPKDVKIDESQSVFTISLSRSMSKLDEVQVIAYGTTTQRLSTADISKVTSKEIEQQPVSNVLSAMQGRVPGVVITQQTGLPGGGFSVQIRGQNSIINGNDPFYVVDGVPYNSQLPGSPINGILKGGSPLNFINPYDIESIEVLKDADATSIYGSRAANGAILITTKKGKAGATVFDVNAYSGFTKPSRDAKFMDTKQYLAMRHEAFANDGATPDPNADFDLTFWDTTKYTNWSKKLIENSAYFTNGRVSVSGGNDNTQYLIGATYFRQNTGFPTVLPGDGIDQQGSAHFSITSFSPNKKFKVQFTGSYLADQNRVQSEDFSTDRFLLPPDAPDVFKADGSLNWAPLSPGQAGTWGNPYGNLYVKYKGTTSNLIGNSIVSYFPIRNLELKASIGYSKTQTNEIQTIPTTVYDPGNNVTSGTSNFNTMTNHSWIVEPQINYKLFVSRGILTALVGGTFLDNFSSVQDIQATGFSSNALLENIQAATDLSVQGADNKEYKYNAFFGRLNYNWQDKYLLNITARRDGSSRFGPGRQFANFGAFGAAWIFTKENFFQGLLPVLNFGKLRFSYGTAGNDQIGDYRYIDLYTSTVYPYQNVQGLFPGNLFNPNLEWEINKKLEGGIELGLFKDRVTLQASYYRNRSSNQLVYTPVSYITGFSTIPSNLPAIVQNKGEEFVVSVIAIKSRNFSWSTAANLTISRNKLVAFPNLAASTYSQQYVVGQPLSIQRVIHLVGVNDTTGIYQFADLKGNPTYNPSFSTDRNTLVNVNPKFYGGFQNTFTYKGLSLDFLVQFVKQTGVNLLYYATLPGSRYNQPVDYLNHWQKPGDIKRFQKFSQDGSGDAYNALSYAQSSDFIYSDASFIRLKNVTLSWQLPKIWQQKIHLNNCRIYVQGQNLFTITNYFGIDPETQTNGLPPLRIWTAGVQVAL